MVSLASTLVSWFGWGGGALGAHKGPQRSEPGLAPLAEVQGPQVRSTDHALQIDAVWGCVDRRARTVASLPLFAYQRLAGGQKELARNSTLWGVLHDSPNARMTPMDFWSAMMLNHDLRGNAYALLERNGVGDVHSMWPLPADQVQPHVLDDGSMVYSYRVDQGVMVLAESSVLHIRNLGNGTVGLDKLAFMRASLTEAATQTRTATALWGNAGKPAGVLMIDRVLDDAQRAKVRSNFAGLAEGPMQSLYILEAEAKYQPISLTPEQQQLLETRRFSVEQICRWYDVPPVLLHHANVTTWGSGIEQIMDGYLKLSIRPMLVSIEQALRKRVMTPRQRAHLDLEFSLDGLLRGNAKDRSEVYRAGVQGGWMTPNEVRQLENLPPMQGADDLLVQGAMTPLNTLGAQHAGT